MLLYAAIAIALSIAVAIQFNTRLHEKKPHVRSYIWGYYNGLMGIFLGAPATYANFLVLARDHADQTTAIMIAAAAAVLCIVLSLYIIRRNRWVFAISTVISLNPILWGINGVYLAKRWDERKAE